MELEAAGLRGFDAEGNRDEDDDDVVPFPFVALARAGAGRVVSLGINKQMGELLRERNGGKTRQVGARRAARHRVGHIIFGVDILKGKLKVVRPTDED